MPSRQGTVKRVGFSRQTDSDSHPIVQTGTTWKHGTVEGRVICSRAAAYLKSSTLAEKLNLQNIEEQNPMNRPVSWVYNGEYCETSMTSRSYWGTDLRYFGKILAQTCLSNPCPSLTRALIPPDILFPSKSAHYIISFSKNSGDSDPGSQSWRFSPLIDTVRAFRVVWREYFSPVDSDRILKCKPSSYISIFS